MVRIAIGGLMHESNTFAGSSTDLAAFEAGGIEIGEGIARRWGEAHHEVGGFLEGACRFGFEAVPTLMAWAVPAGPVTARAYRELTDRLIDGIRAVGPVDAVLLALHGAMVAEGEPEADAATLDRIREFIGPEVPLIATLDYHANVPPRMAESANALVAYQTYPHVDQRETGLAAAELACRAAQREVRPVLAIAKPPLLVPILAQETGEGPMGQLLRQVAPRLDEESRVLSWGLLAGFPYADVPWAGPTCVVVADGDAGLARSEADRLSEVVWESRQALNPRLPSPSEAVAEALNGEGLALLIDVGDNIGGGSAADSTVLFHELLRQGATQSWIVLHDPQAVRESLKGFVAPGSEVEVEAGGKVDRHAPPLRFRGRLRLRHHGQYVENEPRHGGVRLNDQGLTVVIELPGENLVVLNSLRHPPFSLGQLTSLGLHPESARVIVVKAAIAYKAAYAPLGARVIEVDTPGLTAANPARFPYRHLRRPILPLDPDVVVVQHKDTLASRV
jgi:microcystin degradation protein MlrC